MTRLARALRLYATAEDMPAKDMAADIGISPSAMSRLMSGKGLVDAASIVRVFAWLTEDPDEVRYDVVEPEPQQPLELVEDAR